MTVYRDVGHVIARVMSIETIDGTKKAGWQQRYQSGYPDSVGGAGGGLSEEERLTQDSMTRAALHRELPEMAWNVLVAKYSINDREVLASTQWLLPRVDGAAHHLFKSKCLTAWAIPRRLSPAFYLLHTWDNDGTPESTLRRWRIAVRKWLDDRVDMAFKQAAPILESAGLIINAAA